MLKDYILSTVDPATEFTVLTHIASHGTYDTDQFVDMYDSEYS